MASACFSFGRRFPGLAGAECLSEGDFTEPGWRTDYGGGKGRKNSDERGMAGFGVGGGGCEKGAGKRAQGKILKRLQVYLEQRKNQKTPKAGQMILVSGDCSAFDRSRNPGEFDYQLYYCSVLTGYSQRTGA